MRVCAPSILGRTFLLMGLPLMAQADKKISFKNDVAPLLAQKCVQCHGLAPSMGNLDLRTREGALKGGQHGPALVAGHAASSNIYLHLTGQQQPQMPMGG